MTPIDEMKQVHTKQVHTFSPDALQNVVVGCLLCFFSGFLYSLGVFSTSVEAAAFPQRSLDGVWSSGLGFLSLFCIPAMFSTGVFLSNDSWDTTGPCGTKTKRAQMVAFAASICFALFAVGGYGVAISSPALIRFAFASVGAGFGLINLHSQELLAGWVPDRPGLAVGSGQLLYGVGALVSSSVYKYLLLNYSTPSALYITAMIMSFPVAVAVPLVKWPLDTSKSQDRGETRPLLQTGIRALTFSDLSRMPSFWIYCYTIFSLRAGMAFLAYFFKIGSTFGADMATLVTSFQAATTIGTLSRPLTGVFIDLFKATEGFFSLGAKNVILALLLMQTVSFLALVPVSAAGSFVGFAIFAGAVQTIFAAGTCCIPLLAREQFGGVNSTVVFGTGGSLAAGLGEIMAVVLVALVEKYAGDVHTPTSYQPYYIISFITSISGLMACLMVRAQKHQVPFIKPFSKPSESYRDGNAKPLVSTVEGA